MRPGWALCCKFVLVEEAVLPREEMLPRGAAGWGGSGLERLKLDLLMLAFVEILLLHFPS